MTIGEGRGVKSGDGEVEIDIAATGDEWTTDIGVGGGGASLVMDPGVSAIKRAPTQFGSRIERRKEMFQVVGFPVVQLGPNWRKSKSSWPEFEN